MIRLNTENSWLYWNSCTLYIDLAIVKWLKNNYFGWTVNIGRFISYKILKVSYIVITENHGVTVK